MPKLSAERLTSASVAATPAGAQRWDSVVTGLGVRAKASGKISFILRYRLKLSRDQKYVTLGSFPTLTVEEARKLARSTLSRVEKGENPAEDAIKHRDLKTLNDLADYYCGEYATNRPLRPTTVRDARKVLEPCLVAYGDHKVLEITTGQLRQACADAATLSGRASAAPYQSPYQSNRLRAVLSRMFHLAEVELKWRTDNPARVLDKRPEAERWDHLSQSQVTKLLLSCDNYSDQTPSNAIRLLLFTGARKSELLQARWDEFDLEKGLWTKPSHHTKQQREHRLELEGPALVLLRRMRDQHPKQGFLFPARKTGDLAADKPRSSLSRPWAAIRKAAGLEGYRLHDLRRTTASFMLNDGASLATVGKTLGHTQPVTTERYARLKPSVQKRALAKAGRRMVGKAAVAFRSPPKKTSPVGQE